MSKQALQATFGLNTEGFAQGLTKAQQQARTAAAQISKDVGGASSGGLQFKSDRQIKRQLGDLTKTFFDGSSSIESFSSAASDALSTVKFGVFGAVAVGAISGIIGRASALVEEIEAVDKSIAHLTAASGQDVKFQTLESLHDQLAEARKDIETTKKEINPEKGFGRINNAVGKVSDTLDNFFGVGGQTDFDSLAPRKEALAKASALEIGAQDKIAEKIRETTAIEQVRLEQGERAGDLAKLNAKYAEEVNAAESEGGSGLAAANALLERQAIEREQINKKFDEQERKAFDAQSEKDDQQRESARKQGESNDVLRLQLSGNQSIADVLKIQLDSTDKITKARRENNTELATALEQEEGLLLLQQRVKKFRETPDQRRNERREARAERRATETEASRARDRLDRGVGTPRQRERDRLVVDAIGRPKNLNAKPLGLSLAKVESQLDTINTTLGKIDLGKNQ